MSLTLPFGMAQQLAAVAAREPASDSAALVAAARRGDRWAFGQLYERYARMVHGLLLARVPRQDAADLVQEVFLQALRSLEGLRDAHAFGGWLRTLARNRAADYHRRAPAEDGARAPGPGDAEPRDDVTASPRATVEALAALAAIRRLPAAYRETLVLRLVEGMTGPEIAERTGLTPESVRVNLHRGMKLLRAELGGGEERRP